MRQLELFWPVKKPFISQRFGENLVPLYKELGMAGHNGLDLVCPLGEPVYAAHDGIVTYAGMDAKEGYGVVIRTTELFFTTISPITTVDFPSLWKTIYWHLLPNIAVRVGQQVKIGDVIGYADTTGYATASHLHFGLKPIAQGENEWSWYNIEQQNGYFGAVDPEPHMSTMTAYQLRTSLMILSDMVKKLSELLTNLLKGRTYG